MPIFCDAHFHLSAFNDYPYKGSSCASSKEEFIKMSSIIKGCSGSVLSLFACHPQNPDIKLLEYLNELLAEDLIDAIGEAGFDLYGPYRDTIDKQIVVFEETLRLAIQYQKPLVLHLRKAFDYLYRYINLLNKVPSLIFHNFPGNSIEASSLLSKLAESYYSFGKQLLNNNKKSLQSFMSLPMNKVLLETDAPFGRLKDEEITPVNHIEQVYKTSYELKMKDRISFEEYMVNIEDNFNKAFML